MTLRHVLSASSVLGAHRNALVLLCHRHSPRSTETATGTEAATGTGTEPSSRYRETGTATAISTEPGGCDRSHRVPAGTWLTA